MYCVHVVQGIVCALHRLFCVDTEQFLRDIAGRRNEPVLVGGEGVEAVGCPQQREAT